MSNCSFTKFFHNHQKSDILLFPLWMGSKILNKNPFILVSFLSYFNKYSKYKMFFLSLCVFNSILATILHFYFKLILNFFSFWFLVHYLQIFMIHSIPALLKVSHLILILSKASCDKDSHTSIKMKLLTRILVFCIKYYLSHVSI